MNLKRLFLTFLILLCMIPGLPRPAAAVSEEELIRQILIYYSHHQQAAETDIAQLLAQLEAQDPEAAEDWRQILSMWRWAVEDLEVTWDILPDGLPQDDSLCIMVMGFQLGDDGWMYPELIHRLEVALAAAEKYPNAYIVCTGGGTAPLNPHISEAEKMAAWLEEKGVDPERIIIEDRSFSTEQNVLFSFEILSRDYPQVNSLALISSDYHLRRCYLLFTAGILLENMPYTIVGDACFDAGYEGTNEGYFEEAKSLGNMVGLSVWRTQRPELTRLTGITVQGAAEYAPGNALALTVTAEYDSGFTRDVTELAEISGYDPLQEGSQDICIRYSENEDTAQAFFTVSVKTPPTTLPPTTPPTSVPAETQAPGQTAVESTPVRIDLVLITLIFSGFLLIPGLCIRPYRGKYEKRRKR